MPKTCCNFSVVDLRTAKPCIVGQLLPSAFRKYIVLLCADQLAKSYMRFKYQCMKVFDFHARIYEKVGLICKNNINDFFTTEFAVILFFLLKYCTSQ